jgi:hypothetical protein
MTEIIIQDDLCKQVESDSEGRQTILRTSKGQASYFNIIPAFNLEDISPELGTGLHPAFVVGGIKKGEILIGTYQAVIRDGEAVSVPNQDPENCINFDAARSACSAAGTGFHLMTNWEWAAVALWSQKYALGYPRGNTESGKSHSHTKEKGTISKYGRTLTGSGPASWRHDGTPFGIADLVGNVWEWNDGLKLCNGKIIMPTDNDFSLPENQWPDIGSIIDLANGVQISDVITNRTWTGRYFKDVTVKEGYEPPVALKQALLSPLAGFIPDGYFWADNNEGFEALPIRGGGWYSGDNAGVAALRLYDGRSIASDALGFRPAFIG